VEVRNKRKILVERCGYSQVFVVDTMRSIQLITTQIAEEGRISNPTAWILCSLIEEVIRDAKDIIEGQTYRLKITIRVEHDGHTKCFNIGEEEDGMMMHHKIHRGLGTDADHWDILDAQGTNIELGSKSRAGAIYFLMEKREQDQATEGHKAVQVIFRWNRVTIPI
jgi:hypothetical protein